MLFRSAPLDEWQSPKSGFQGRLERMRSRARTKSSRGARRASFEADDEDDEDDDDDVLFEKNFSWAEKDEDFIAHIQVCLALHYMK